MVDFTQYINDHGYPDVTVECVQATAMFHKEWQVQHAEKVRQERKVINAQKEEDRKKREEKREQDKKDRAAKKEQDDAAKEARKKEREDAKAAKEAADAESGADGDDSTSDGEPAKPRQRLRTRGEEPVAAGASAGEFG
jgi:hypothetical protein